MTPKLKNTDVFPCNWVISLSRIMHNASIESSHQELHFFLYTDEHWAIYEDVMTKKAQQLDDLTVLWAV